MGMVRCPQCRNEVPVSQVRYTSPDDYVCENCATPVHKKEVSNQSSRNFDVSPDTKQVLVCDDCGFENKTKKDAQSVSCSYCGGSSLHADGTRAADLIAEVDEVNTTE